jgi:hypothetical protein
MSSLGAEDTLFGHLNQHEVFTPTRTYPPSTVRALAELALGDAPPGAL